MKIAKILVAGLLAAAALGSQGISAAQPEISWDSMNLIVDGRPVVPAMGEVHFSRIPSDEWRHTVRDMKEGGISILCTYIFWNHHEESEGIFDWSGQRDLRHFLEICKEEGMPVVLRLGPFCHGEVRNGGVPDWVFERGLKSRSEDPAFLEAVGKLYRQIFAQVQGLQWKDGGPVMAAQFDNEYRGHGSYLMALKKIATAIGFDLPFYTRTGWPELKSPVPFGEMIPLYGDYADGFWERSIQPTAGNYYKAFNFKEFRSSTAIASEQLGEQKEKLTAGDEQYPYFTCELGGGMMPSYHRRVYVYPEDAYSLAVVKLGSGSNLLGYYMYRGGTNPEGHRGVYLNETQRTPATNYNDMPDLNYDFQAPLGEFGQRNPHFYTLRKLHLFMHDFGEGLAPMPATFHSPQDLKKGQDTELRWATREAGDSGYIFVNNYERLQPIKAKRGVALGLGDVKLPKLDIPAGTVCIFPVNIAGLRYATAQLVARRDGKIYLEQIPGIPTTLATAKRTLKNVKPLGPDKPVYGNYYLLTPEQAGRLFLADESPNAELPAPTFRKVKDAGAPRTITIGKNKAAESPLDADFDAAAVYIIENLPAAEEREGRLLDIAYRGDVARLYADGKLIDDNFYNGRHMQYGLWRLPADCRGLELRILPLQPDMPVYFPAEADTRPGEELIDITIK